MMFLLPFFFVSIFLFPVSMKDRKKGKEIGEYTVIVSHVLLS